MRVLYVRVHSYGMVSCLRTEGFEYGLRMVMGRGHYRLVEVVCRESLVEQVSGGKYTMRPALFLRAGFLTPVEDALRVWMLTAAFVLAYIVSP